MPERNPWWRFYIGRLVAPDINTVQNLVDYCTLVDACASQ